jgi:hypothetical protein
VAIALFCFGIWKLTRSTPAAAPLAGEQVRAHEAAAPTRELEQPPALMEDSPRVALETAQAPAANADGAPATLRVLVRSKSDQRPIAGVHVSLAPAKLEGLRTLAETSAARGGIDAVLTTGDDGRVEFEAPSATDLVLRGYGKIGAAGSASADVAALSPGETREITLELPTGDDLVFCGRVVDRETRASIASAWIDVKDANGGHSITSDLDGRFELALAKWKRPALRVEAEGYGPALVVPSAGHEERDHALEVSLSRVASLHVSIRGASGEPLEDVEAKLTTPGYNMVASQEELLSAAIDVPDPTWTARTDASGRAELLGLPAAMPLHLTLSQERRVVLEGAAPIVLEPGESRDVEYDIGRGCHVNGRLVDQAEQAVAKQELWLVRAKHDVGTYFLPYMDEQVVMRTRTDEAGRFVLDDVAPGSWWLGSACLRRQPQPGDPTLVAPAGQVVEIAAGVASQDVVLHVDRGLYIRGHVQDSEGEPADGIVQSFRTPIAGGITAQVDATGVFALGPLVAGPHDLQAWSGADSRKSEIVSVEAGAEGVVLVLREGGTVQGIVTDAETQRPAAAAITIVAEGGPELGMLAVSSTEDGSFRGQGLEPGTYALCARTSDGRCGILRHVEVRAGTTTSDLVIALSAGAKLRLRYQGDEDFASIVVLVDGVAIAMDGVEKGHEVEWTVAAGSLTVRMYTGSPEPADERVVQLAAGETQAVVFGKD